MKIYEFVLVFVIGFFIATVITIGFSKHKYKDYATPKEWNTMTGLADEAIEIAKDKQKTIDSLELKLDQCSWAFNDISSLYLTVLKETDTQTYIHVKAILDAAARIKTVP